MTPLKSWMEQHGFTNSTLAARLGYTYVLVYKVAEGERPVSNGFKFRFAEEFGMDEAKKIADAESAPATAK